MMIFILLNVLYVGDIWSILVGDIPVNAKNVVISVMVPLPPTPARRSDYEKFYRNDTKGI
jgi:hypothetical protein